MKLQTITLEELLDNAEIRAVYFEHSWYFSINDLNKLYLWTFKNVSPVPLPLKVREGRQMTNCVSYEDIIAILVKI